MRSARRTNLHRLNDQVAFSTEGMPNTVYLDPQHALWLAHQMIACAADIDYGPPFSKSTFCNRYYDQDAPDKLYSPPGIPGTPTGTGT